MNVMSHPIRVLVVDDAPGVRGGLRLRLGREPDLEIVGEAEDGCAAVHLAADLRPDIVLLDAVLPGQDGFSTAAQLKTAAPGCAIVMLSLHDDRTARAHARAAGAAAFVGKHEPLEILLSTIRNTAGQG